MRTLPSISRPALAAALMALAALSGCGDDQPPERYGKKGEGVALPPSQVETDPSPQSGTGGLIPGNNPQLIEGRQNVAGPEEERTPLQVPGTPEPGDAGRVE